MLKIFEYDKNNLLFVTAANFSMQDFAEKRKKEREK
jgi:hypothetical protein